MCLQCIHRLFNILKQSSDLRNVALQVITLLMHYSWKSLEGLNMSKHCFQSSEVCSYPIQEKGRDFFIDKHLKFLIMKNGNVLPMKQAKMGGM